LAGATRGQPGERIGRNLQTAIGAKRVLLQRRDRVNNLRDPIKTLARVSERARRLEASDGHYRPQRGREAPR
jgi:hypothetical protein